VSFKAFRTLSARGHSADFRKNAMQFQNSEMLDNEADILHHQVYEPYFISNATILLSGDPQKKSSKRYSLIDIIEAFVKFKSISSCKMYFKVNHKRV